MQIFIREEVDLSSWIFEQKIARGSIFIHPTDTIYGLGCNALDDEAVKKLRAIKQRGSTPLSIIAPSKSWIYENCEVTEEAEDWIGKLPGPYTLILRKKQLDCVASNVTPGVDTIGVRIPDHWISKFVKRLGYPIITTSANITGDQAMTSIDDLDDRLKTSVDFAIYEDELEGRPSKVIDLTENAKVLRE